MRKVTLITDYGTKDFYLGVLKGFLYGLDPNLTVVDIANDVKKYDIREAAFIAKHTLPFWPQHTLHIIDVGLNKSKFNEYLLFKTNNGSILLPDNGLISMILKDPPTKAAVMLGSSGSDTFPLLKFSNDLQAFFEDSDAFFADRMVDVTYDTKFLMEPTFTDDQINGVVLYVDSYGNAITNISRSLFESVGKQRKFKINIRREVFTSINNWFDKSEGHELAFFNAFNKLTFAIFAGSTNQLMDFNNDDSVTVVFQ